MSRRTILDTGPLVAMLSRRDYRHEWACAIFGRTEGPMLTTESVLTEACFLLRHFPDGCADVVETVCQGVVEISSPLRDNPRQISDLLRKYADLPISLADASLVLLSEKIDDCQVLTFDSHFKLYRRRGRGVIPTIMPPGL
ncbi:MAG: type II toxin-antitoxin system VapC family toxin [Phycisphaerae bacterium]